MKSVQFLLVVIALGFASLTAADTYEQNLDLGTADSKQNHINDPFVTPSKITPLTNPSTWPKFQNRAPLDRSPSDKSSKLITWVLAHRQPAPTALARQWPYCEQPSVFR